MQNFMSHQNKPMSFLLSTIQSSCHQLGIVLSFDGVCTLVDVVIVNPIQIDLVSQTVLSGGVLMTIVTQMRNGLY
jgi:hypothetical protein